MDVDFHGRVEYRASVGLLVFKEVLGRAVMLLFLSKEVLARAAEGLFASTPGRACGCSLPRKGFGKAAV